MEDPNVRYKFFVQVSHGKRSFQLRKEDVNEKKIALMSALASFSLHDTATKKIINHDKDGNFEQLDPSHEYEVILKKEVHESSDGFYKACKLEDLHSAPNKRLRLPINERDITIFAYKKSGHKGERISAIDSVCYHLGGPLIEGDIEDVEKWTCVICPWHRYRIDLESGEGLYLTPDGYCSKGEKQRVHETKVEGGFVYVKLKEGGEEIASDHYAYMGLYKQPVSKTPPRVPVHSRVVNSENSN